MKLFKILFKLIRLAILLSILFTVFMISLGTYKLYQSINGDTFEFHSFINGKYEKSSSKVDKSKIIIENLTITNNFDIIGNTMTFLEFRDKLMSIKDDEKIEGILFNLDTFKMKNTEFDEIRPILKEIGENKHLYFYTQNMTKSKYYKAITGKIIMPESSSATFSLNGYAFRDRYYKGLFDKIGIEQYVVKTGDNKTVFENLYSDNISEAKKEQQEKLIKYYENRFITTLRDYRNKSLKTYEYDLQNGDNTYSNAILAKNKNYIDDYMYYDEITPMLNIKKYRIKTEKSKTEKPIIAVLNLQGEIGEEYPISIKKVQKQIQKLHKLENIRGIIVRIDSPGGSSYVAERIYKLIKEVAKDFNVPVYISASNVLASGGYYISLAGDKIYVANGTIVGSIGVVSLIPKINKLNEKLGINNVVINDFPYETTNDVNIPYNQDDIDKLEKQIKYIYNDFKTQVSISRSININTVEKLAGGKIYTTDEAFDNHLIDGIKTYGEVLEKLKDEIDEDVDVVVIDNSDIDYKSIIFKEIYRYINKYNKVENKYLYK